MKQGLWLGVVLQLVISFSVLISESTFAESKVLSDQVKALKSDLVQLNRELYELEEALINPANTQVSVFLSLSAVSNFDLDSVELKLDGNTATTYLYKESELKALKRGGVQRLYIGNISSGSHTLTAVLNGLGESDRYFRREQKFSFDKASKPKMMELQIIESKKKEPEFKVKEWN